MKHVIMPLYYWVKQLRGKGDFDKEAILDNLIKGRELLARQAQHEATWAMAMEAAKNAIPFDLHNYALLRAIPCPPLQTTNEKPAPAQKGGGDA